MSVEQYDLIVIGGGIQGAGVAQAAAAAGHSVALFEQYDMLAQGTSSRSSKLIHGGLRYLETRQFSLVRECLRERALLLKNAPDFVSLKAFHIPVYECARHGVFMLKAGLAAYALLNGLRADSHFNGLPRSAWDGLDGLRTDGLRAVLRYYDGQADDAVLTRAVMTSAIELGAELRLSHTAECIELNPAGVEVTFQTDAGEFHCRARALVNAAGPWALRVLDRVMPAQSIVPVELVAGTHVILDRRLDVGIYYVEASDGRPVFIMPWQGQTLIGTTERVFNGDPACIKPSAGEVDYLLDTYRRYFPGEVPQMTNAFAGLRVLPSGGDPNRRPREALLLTDRKHKPRVLSVLGGKLTVYRATAERIMNKLELPERMARGDTRRLSLRAQ